MKLRMIGKLRYLLLIIVTILCPYSNTATTTIINSSKQFQVIKLEMFLNAFGVESDGFPTINAKINFTTNASFCDVSYYEPWLKEKKYFFSKKQIGSLKHILENFDLSKLKRNYDEGPTDQPTSITTIYTSQDTFRIKDYGLQAKYPMSELYRIVYDLKRNFR